MISFWEWLIDTFVQTILVVLASPSLYFCLGLLLLFSATAEIIGCILFFEEFKINPLKYVVIILLLGFVGFILTTYGIYLKEVC